MGWMKQTHASTMWSHQLSKSCLGLSWSRDPCSAGYSLMGFGDREAPGLLKSRCKSGLPHFAKRGFRLFPSILFPMEQRTAVLPGPLSQMNTSFRDKAGKELPDQEHPGAQEEGRMWAGTDPAELPDQITVSGRETSQNTP